MADDGPERWNSVDDYLTRSLVPADPALEEALARSDEAGLPAIHVAANQGRLLQILAQIRQARAILEIGTLGGYSTIWLARALPPDGRLLTLELDPHHAAVAADNIAHAGLDHIVQIRTGPAAETLAQLVNERHAPFDFIFIDADKAAIADYFEWSLKLSRPGTMIIMDNVVRDGAVVDADSPDDKVQGVRRLLERLGREQRVSATAIQTVGSKGYDGFAIAVVTG